MHWLLLFFAAVAAFFAGGFIWWRVKAGAEIGLMRATETSKAGEVAGKAPGTLVEVKGSVRSDAPIKSEFAGVECVYYRSLVEREVQRTRRDSDGKSRTERTFETESDTSRHASARVEDESGAAALDFTGARVEAEQVHRRTESSGLGGIGGLLNVSGSVLGYRYTEWAIRPGAALYVLGTALAGGGVGKSPDKASKNPFVVSIKSEEERTKSLTRTQMWTLIGAIVAALAAAGLVYAAVANWGA